MKTSEFKKRLGELQYVVCEHGEFIDIKAMFGKQCASISTTSNLLELNTVSLELAKLCIEYAETPISEREDEKKYTVVLPDPRNTNFHQVMLTKKLPGVCIGFCHASQLEALTESEIKRNHEYLWQFAKEVKE